MKYDASNCLYELIATPQAGLLRSRGGRLQHASALQDRYLFRTTSRLSPIGRAGTTAEEKPVEFAVEAAEAALHFERLCRIQSFPECFQNSWQVVGMNRDLPSRAQNLLWRETRIVQPALIEKLSRAVWTSGPCQGRDGVDYKANVLYICLFFEAMPQGCHARIIEPYGFKDYRDSSSNTWRWPVMPPILPARCFVW
jgi:hypothetical protein